MACLGQQGGAYNISQDVCVYPPPYDCRDGPMPTQLMFSGASTSSGTGYSNLGGRGPDRGCSQDGGCGLDRGCGKDPGRCLDRGLTAAAVQTAAAVKTAAAV